MLVHTCLDIDVLRNLRWLLSKRGRGSRRHRGCPWANIHWWFASGLPDSSCCILPTIPKTSNDEHLFVAPHSSAALSKERHLLMHAYICISTKKSSHCILCIYAISEANIVRRERYWIFTYLASFYEKSSARAEQSPRWREPSVSLTYVHITKNR